ncbi:hypothetical protein B0T25DRAFT_230661 [Lasiosphaeria hispida]|uniref:MYND-type domain-containing protein n=1 Tax=Lasiosphaeria hispida TaxID=260671 RepID=A0AAJ0HE06_9PEZI|nr:hypothetical protein B0T25DRAFT_230661 [Lasiosphaeria hispida]
MSQSFGWEPNGVGRVRFQALIKLLHLRHNGQIERPTRLESVQLSSDTDDAVAEAADDDSTKAMTLADSNSDYLQRSFLDRLAELVADQKGGRHVAATMMVTTQDSVTVLVAKNDKFGARDGKFLGDVGAQLQLIAKSTSSGRQEGGDQDALWKTLLVHYETRIQGYITDFRPLLRGFKQAKGQIAQGLTVNLSLASHLIDLHEVVFGQHASTLDRNQTIIFRAHYMYKTFSEGDFARLSFPQSGKIRDSLGFLGRLRTAFFVLVRAAERLPNFSELRIRPVEHQGLIKAETKDGTSTPRIPEWTLAKLFQHLGSPLEDDRARALLGSTGRKTRWTKNKLLQAFDNLKSSTWQVHAEMQLLPSYMEVMSTNSSVFEYIGCSKKSCFLCWHFLDLLGGIKTRGCHGKLYSLWDIPDFQCVAAVQEKVTRAMLNLESLVKREILNQEAGFLPHSKESSIGGSSIETRIPGSDRLLMSDTVLSHLRGQRESLAFRAASAEEPPREDAMTTSDATSPSNNVENVVGSCDECCETTSRKCSHCRGAWFCSVWCEDQSFRHVFKCNRRSITTADTLREDCLKDRLPDDPQTCEDYGFRRCANSAEMCKLLGLYQGIFGVRRISSQEVHTWRTQGLLAEKIIGLFSAIPEDCRGGYYKWFLDHRYVLEVEDDADEEEAVWIKIATRDMEERQEEAKAYLDPSDQNKTIDGLEPFAKQYCFLFLVTTLGNEHMGPVEEGLDFWFDFGFVACPGRTAESNLGLAYHKLFTGNKFRRGDHISLRKGYHGPRDGSTCSFEDFWKAWEAGCLMELFDRHDISVSSSAREFMSYPAKSPRPSVWKLKKFLEFGGTQILTADPAMNAAAIEYGLHPGLDARTRLDLHQFYSRLFQGHVDPSVIDRARAERKLCELAEEWAGTNVGERVKRVLGGVPYDAGTQLEIPCSRGRRFSTNAAMQQHQRDSPLHLGVGSGSAGATSGKTLEKQQYANFRDKTIFPDFAGLPDESHINMDFYRTTNGVHFFPRKHWCFMAEIVSVESLPRLRLTVKSGTTRVPIAFYTPDSGAEIANQAQVGYTVAVLYARQHSSIDLTTGIPVEEVDAAKIIPVKLAELLALSDRVRKYSTQGSDTTCHGCDERKASLRKCSRCSMFWYCGKTCQTTGWTNKGHKNDCKVIRTCGLRAMLLLDWNRFEDFTGFPLPEPK